MVKPTLRTDMPSPSEIKRNGDYEDRSSEPIPYTNDYLKSGRRGSRKNRLSFFFILRCYLAFMRWLVCFASLVLEHWEQKVFRFITTWGSYESETVYVLFLICTPQRLLVSLFGEISIEIVSVFKTLKPPVYVQLTDPISTMLGTKQNKTNKTKCH